MGWPDLGGGPKTWGGIHVSGGRRSGQTMGAHGEDDGDASSHRLAAVQGGLLAQPQVLRLAAVALPAGDGGAVQHHLDALARGQGCNDLGACARAHNVDLGFGARGIGGLERRGAVRAVDHVVGGLGEGGVYLER